MASIFQMTFSNAFSSMKMYTFPLRFHWSLFPRIQLTTSSIGSDNGLAPYRWQAIIWTNGGIVYWCIYVSLGLNELRSWYDSTRSPSCWGLNSLWSNDPHIASESLVIYVLDSGLLPVWCQAISWPKFRFTVSWARRCKLRWIWIKIQIFVKKCIFLEYAICKMLAILASLNVVYVPTPCTIYEDFVARSRYLRQG